MIELAVTDTHPLVWYAQGYHRRLGSHARRIFEAAEHRRAVIYVPALALAELAEGIRRGGIRLADSYVRWTEMLFRSPHFVPVDLTRDVVLRAEELYAIPERGDRLIAATAAHLGYPLITRDPEIGRAAGVEVVW